MDVASEAKRRAEALDRIVKSAEAIGSELELSDLATNVATTHHRVPAYKQLFQLEAVAELLEVVAREIAPDYMPSLNVTPTALELAEQQGVDLTKVEGTGTDGRILKSDVLAAVDTQSEEKAAFERQQAIEQAEANSTPAALKYANENGVDLTLVEGTGANGKITLDDVKLAQEGQTGGISIFKRDTSSLF